MATKITELYRAAFPDAAIGAAQDALERCCNHIEELPPTNDAYANWLVPHIEHGFEIARNVVRSIGSSKSTRAAWTCLNEAKASPCSSLNSSSK